MHRRRRLYFAFPGSNLLHAANTPAAIPLVATVVFAVACVLTVFSHDDQYEYQP